MASSLRVVWVLALASLLGCGARTRLRVGDDEAGARDAGAPGDVRGDARAVDARSVDALGRDAGRDAGAGCDSDDDCPDDGLACNGLVRCVGARCVALIPEPCDDGIECTEDTCLEDGGGRATCEFVPDDRRCGPSARCVPGAGCQTTCTPTGPVESACGDRRDDDCDGAADCRDADCMRAPECSGCTEPIEVSCTDRRDNDCDRFVDCSDPDCVMRPECTSCIPIGPREIECGDGLDDDCDTRIDCFDVDCMGTPGCCTASGDIETQCRDGLDDDCDGALDCADGDCRGFPECTVCMPTSRVEVMCLDGLDDDCNGFTDCADFNCSMSPLCRADVGLRDAGPFDAAVCVPTARSEASCTNGVDDDCNGLTDCADLVCSRAPGCLDVDAGFDAGFDAGDAGTDAGPCRPTSRVELRCRDGLDDDCNGLTDCADPICAMRPVCTGCVPTSRMESSCTDMLDNDCDGQLDCLDSDCRGRPVCTGMCTPTAMQEIGPGACTDGRDNDCDGRPDCADSDCSPFGPMGECCNNADDNGDGLVDEFTCRCNSPADCRGVGSLEQTCWTETFSICAPRCNLIGGDRFCREAIGAERCDRVTGECI